MIDFKAVEKEIIKNREVVTQKLIEFSFTDTILFWSDDIKLKKIQEKEWAPVLHWITKKFEIKMKETTTLSAPLSNMDNRTKMEKIIDEMSPKKLTCFYLAAVRLKSTLLSLTMVEKQISPKEAFELAYLEENYQNKYWGTEKESEDARLQVKEEILQIGEYLAS